MNKYILMLFVCSISAMQPEFPVVPYQFPIRPADVVLIHINPIEEKQPEKPHKQDSPRTPVKLAQIKSSTKVKLACLAAATSVIGCAVTLTIHFTSCK